MNGTNLEIVFVSYRNGMRLLINEAIISRHGSTSIIDGMRVCLHFYSLSEKKRNCFDKEKKDWMRINDMNEKEWQKNTKRYEWDKINKYRFTILLLSIENYFNYIVFIYFHYELHELHDENYTNMMTSKELHHRITFRTKRSSPYWMRKDFRPKLLLLWKYLL